jgi:hypothetical protein
MHQQLNFTHRFTSLHTSLHITLRYTLLFTAHFSLLFSFHTSHFCSFTLLHILHFTSLHNPHHTSKITAAFATGLPHLHAVFFVQPEDRPHSAEIVDRIVTAQLPDSETDPAYFSAVTKHMMHGPCGVLNPTHYCMKHGQCRFDYPKKLQDTTTIPQDGYTKLARPFGRSVVMNGFVADNSWVVPHNKFLLMKYDAHINLECSASIAVVKYLFSYIYKGSKTSSATVHNSDDEIQLFSDGRLTSAAESIWHVLGFDLHKQEPAVQRLGCSLPDDPDVQFSATHTPDEVADAADEALRSTSHIVAWFELNAVDAFARTLLYVDIPVHYIWSSHDRRWKRRKYKIRVLGRIYPVDPSSREAWALRVLLQHSRGCVSSTDLRTVCGEERETFWEAAVAAGLMDDDREYHRCLSSTQISPTSLRALFLIIITKCQPRDPMFLLHTFFEELTSDFLGQHAHKLALLYQHIMHNVDVELEVLGLSMPPDALVDTSADTFLETFVSHPLLCNNVTLNAEQQHVHDCVLHDMTLPVGHVFVLTAPAGTGKTFLINAILASARSTGLRVVPCASSGLAASLLGHARTGHGLFKIPTQLEELSHCRPRAVYKCVPIPCSICVVYVSVVCGGCIKCVWCVCAACVHGVWPFLTCDLCVVYTDCTTTHQCFQTTGPGSEPSVVSFGTRSRWRINGHLMLSNVCCGTFGKMTLLSVESPCFLQVTCSSCCLFTGLHGTLLLTVSKRVLGTVSLYRCS